MKKLEIEMYRFKNVLFGYVVNMAEELRDYGTLAKVGDYSIQSYAIPLLAEDNLFVQGKMEEYDNLAFCHSYLSEYMARRAENAFKALIDEINGETKDLPSEAKSE